MPKTDHLQNLTISKYYFAILVVIIALGKTYFSYYFMFFELNKV